MLGSSGGIKFVILVEDSETRGPSLITLTMEYLFVLQIWCCELNVGSQWRGREEMLLLIFIIWGCFDRQRVRVDGAR